MRRRSLTAVRVVLSSAFLVLPLVAAIPAHANPSAFREAYARIRAGDPERALQVLLPLRETEAGNAQYHYLEGLALLDSGDLPRAVAALRRSLAIDPKLLQARAELGRAHVLSGEPIKAWLAFRELQRDNPPPGVLAGVDRFLAQSAAQANSTARLSGSVALSAGYDTNANFGPSATTVMLPFFGNITAILDPALNPKSGPFVGASGSLFGRHELSADAELIGSAAASGRYQTRSELAAFDVETLAFAVGAQFRSGASQWRALAVYDRIDFDQRSLRSESGFALDWRHLTRSPIELNLNYRHTRLDYPSSPARDATRDVVGIALLPSLFGNRIQFAPPLVNAYVGRERTDEPDARHLGYSLWGIRASGYWRLGSYANALISGGFESRLHDAQDPTFLESRHDRQHDLLIAAAFEITKGVAIIPSVQMIESRSNLDVYAFRRTMTMVSARYAF